MSYCCTKWLLKLINKILLLLIDIELHYNSANDSKHFELNFINFNQSRIIMQFSSHISTFYV